jgi:hypothetical protein
VSSIVGTLTGRGPVNWCPFALESLGRLRMAG